VVVVELGVVEQRLRAVLEVINDGATVTAVARRHGVSRQTVNVWLRRFVTPVARGGDPLDPVILRAAPTARTASVGATVRRPVVGIRPRREWSVGRRLRW